jgi:putative DNA primase/helicase
VRLEFPVSHLGEEDVSLKARLRQPEHLAGVLRWAVEGARRWYVEGLEIPAALQAHLAATRDELDTVQHWLEESTLPDATSFLSNDTIRSSYQEWCEAQGFKPMNGMHLSRTITTKEAYTIHKKSGRRGIVGLRLRLGVA